MPIDATGLTEDGYIDAIVVPAHAPSLRWRVQVRLIDTAKHVMASIEQAHGIPQRIQMLSCNGVQVGRDSVLHQLASVVFVLVCRDDMTTGTDVGPAMSLTIAVIDGRRLTVVAHCTNTVGELQRAIERKYCIPYEVQLLVFCGQRLDACVMLGHYSIQRDTVLHLVTHSKDVAEDVIETADEKQREKASCAEGTAGNHANKSECATAESEAQVREARDGGGSQNEPALDSVIQPERDAKADEGPAVVERLPCVARWLAAMQLVTEAVRVTVWPACSVAQTRREAASVLGRVRQWTECISYPHTEHIVDGCFASLLTCVERTLSCACPPNRVARVGMKKNK